MTTDINAAVTEDELKAEFEDQYSREDPDLTEASKESETCWITTC